MRKKLKLKPCIEVPFGDKLYEGYEILEGRAIIANVSVDKVKDMMTDFIGMYDEPLFFFLELPGHLPDGFNEGFIKEGEMKGKIEAVVELILETKMPVDKAMKILKIGLLIVIIE